METYFKICLILSSIFAYCSTSKVSVPLFLWSSDRLDSPKPVVGLSINPTDFHRDYAEPLLKSKQNIVAFIQDKLSLDDITHLADVYNLNSDGATFHNLKSLLNEHENRQLSAVDNIPLLVKQLKQKFQGKIHELKEPYNVKDLDLDADSNLIITKLPSTGQSESEFIDAVHKNDMIMKSVTDDLKGMKQPYTAMYTANKPSRRSRRLAVGRHLLANDAVDKTFFNITPYLYFYTTQINVDILKYAKVDNNYVLSGKTRFVLDNKMEFDKQASDAGNATGVLVVNYGTQECKTNTTKDASMEIKFKFSFSIGTGQIWSGFWRLSEMNVTYSGKNSTSDAFEGDNVALKGEEIYAPISGNYQFCYHCTNSGYREKKPSEPTKPYFIAQVTFEDLSVQYATTDYPMQENSDGVVQFGRPNDCDGFFTIPILSGLFAGLILIMILFFGISMISSIETMDRFDDPKGKTITVNVADT